MKNKDDLSIQIDELDLKILKLVQQNAKIGTKELASKLNLTYTPTYERIRKLEKNGYIKGYHADIDLSKLGKKLTVFTQVSLKVHTRELLDDFESAVTSFPEVQLCAHISGDFDYLLEITVNNIEDYREFVVSKLSKIDHIAKLHSNFVLKLIKENNSFL